MRTTLTLDDDIAETLDDDIADYLKERARLLNKSFKQVVNDTLRRGMFPPNQEVRETEYRLVPNRSGFVPGVNPLKLNQLNDQLEAADFNGLDAG